MTPRMQFASWALARRPAAGTLVLLLGLTFPVQADPNVEPETDSATQADGLSPGRWNRIRSTFIESSIAAAESVLVEQLESLGYVQGSRPVRSRGGVTRYNSGRAFPGLNFYTSGHGPEAILMDMDGREIHRWACDYQTAFPDRPEREREYLGSLCWRRAVLLPNGDVIAIFEGLGMVKLDRNSNVLWAIPNHAHHALQILPSGDIYVLTRKAHVLSRLHARRPVLEDFISILGADGSDKGQVSLLECFENSPMRIILEEADVRTGDLFHTNSLQILDGRTPVPSPYFASGNILTSLRRLNTIAVVDLQRRQVVWAHQGDYVRQHDPRLLENGRIQLFDNGVRGSRVLEIDPGSGEVVWQYLGSEKEPFFSAECGTAQRLPNGSTLITESESGRAFEVTSDGETVWEFISPFRTGAEEEFIATLFEVVRIAPPLFLEWLGAPGNAE